MWSFFLFLFFIQLTFQFMISVGVLIREVGKERGKENFYSASAVVRWLHTFWGWQIFKVDSLSGVL